MFKLHLLSVTAEPLLMHIQAVSNLLLPLHASWLLYMESVMSPVRRHIRTDLFPTAIIPHSFLPHCYHFLSFQLLCIRIPSDLAL